MRADAQRNYDLLLAAARQIFAERGPDAPLDDVARRAGVGNATMYRHFPTRCDLIIAVYRDEVAELCATGAALLGAQSPQDALHEWLRLFVEHVATKRDLALAVSRESDTERSALLSTWHESMTTTASELLDRAQQAGAVRADLDVRDLLTLVNGVALATADGDQADRLLAVVGRGLLPES
ncbi:helix-turn-helix domain-containing protein [Nonomuraea sp. NPDC005983]|uniref:TetR/AcrR family transcriptional regulator n=1 Tax=Nonomuraea sp. NPDC005983 TaxID=3155595 RepID=UPI0033A19A2B